MGTSWQFVIVFGVVSLTATLAIADDTEKVRSLADVVRDFNEKAQRNEIGRMQPPLTEEEVIAAILGWKNVQPKAHKEYYEAIQKVSKTRTVPPNVSLSSLSNYNDGKGRKFDVWWISIQIEKKSRPIPRLWTQFAQKMDSITLDHSV